MPDNISPESPSRRRFVSVAAATVAAGSLSQLAFAETNQMITEAAPPAGGDKTAIRPLRVHVPESQLIDLRRRINATRWPERETVTDDSQGVPLAMIQEFARHWSTGYDWRKCEAKLNSLPNFVTEIDELDVHFIHVRSHNENAMPLIVTHGWPGSVIEQFKIIDPLTNPTAYGASASDAFHLVIPSLPGYGFSGKPSTTGWGPERTARAWVLLMKRLGYEKFAAQGGDLGGIVANVMAKQAPPELLGIHVNFPATVPPEIVKALQAGDPPPAGLSDDEKHAYEQLGSAAKKRRAYALEMGTRPQTLYGLSDSPIALASWLLDHGDGYCAAGCGTDLGRVWTLRQWRIRRRADTRRPPRRHHALLVDEHGDFRRSVLLGVSLQLHGRRRRICRGCRQRLSSRELSGAAELDRAGVSQPHLLQPPR
jgi:pimeloyl-ACP methyl ester carboxylesterase